MATSTPARGTLGQTDLGVMGPMGRSAADLSLAMDVLTGTDVRGVPGARLPERRDGLASLAGLRIGVWLDDESFPTDAAVLGVLELGHRPVGEAGATLVDDARPATPLGDLHRSYLGLLAGAARRRVPGPGDRRRAARWSTPPIPTTPRSASRCPGDWCSATATGSWRTEQRARYQAEWADLFESVDVLITPVTPVGGAASRHGHPDGPAHDRRSTARARPPTCDQLVWAGLATLPYLPGHRHPRRPDRRTGLRSGSRSSAPSSPTAPRSSVAALAEEVLGGFVPPPFPFRGSPPEHPPTGRRRTGPAPVGTGRRYRSATPGTRGTRASHGTADRGVVMSVSAYVLIQTEVGKAAEVADRDPGDRRRGRRRRRHRALRRDRPGRGRHMDDLGKMVVSRVQMIDGITRTLTCPVVNL